MSKPYPIYPGDRIQALGLPRLPAPSGCEAVRDATRANATGTAEQVYGSFVRVKWDDSAEAEAGWRRLEDFSIQS